MDKTRRYTDQDDRQTSGRECAGHTWCARAFVLGGPALAVVYTTATLALDAGVEHIGPLWLAAIAWTFAVSLSGALWRGYRHRDWSAFSRYELPEDDGELHEFTFKTGRYSWLREMEDELLHDDHHIR